MEEGNDKDSIAVVLSDGETVHCLRDALCDWSPYFQGLMDSGMAEARRGEVTLAHLDPEAVTLLLQYMRDHHQSTRQTEQRKSSFNNKDGLSRPTSDNTTTSLPVYFGGFDEWTADRCLRCFEALDYLQLSSGCHDGASQFEVLQRSAQLMFDLSDLQSYFVEEGWITKTTKDSNDSFTLVAMPEGRKKRKWRFWLGYWLCLHLFPIPIAVKMDQATLTHQLGGIQGSGGGSVALRRELVDYDLLERTGDGSAYWRPDYRLKFLRRYQGSAYWRPDYRLKSASLTARRSAK